MSRAVAQAVCRSPLNTYARVHLQVNHVGFVLDKVALGEVIIRILRSSTVSVILPIFHIHSFITSVT
jgi:hypothetical protein